MGYHAHNLEEEFVFIVRVNCKGRRYLESISSRQSDRPDGRERGASVLPI